MNYPILQYDIFFQKYFTVHERSAVKNLFSTYVHMESGRFMFLRVSVSNLSIIKLSDMLCYDKDDCFGIEKCEDGRCILPKGEYCRHHTHCKHTEICLPSSKK